MRPCHGIYFVAVAAICMFYLEHAGSGGGCGVRAQDFLNASIAFENITFDMANRGSYNISYCIEDMLNCMEIVKADTLCFEWRYFSSVCAVMREFCAEFWHDQDEYYKNFYLQESVCYSYDYYHFWT